ncbi:YdcH family protein [Psychromarinibacter sp. C21-152]|uniref:YdcH family protein n=1 Tax=Psychromarinibacter sediminicola TaxID=3033385 RepID=A0AAE3NXI9_9RHOB|nr:YdcH family protein [Psychromarinibacter sediminicola]MDF0603926.1 YdcH family protein [Psychromarinibacter sediminicola]
MDAELQRPMPCSLVLKRLKRQRLRMKDQIAHYTGQMRRADGSDGPTQVASRSFGLSF